MVTFPLTLLNSLHTRCVSHQLALHKAATVSMHQVHGGSARAHVPSQHLSPRQPLSHCTTCTEAQHVHTYLVNTMYVITSHQLSPAGSKEPPQNNHRVHAAHGTIYPVMRLYPLSCIPCHVSVSPSHVLVFPVKYLYSLSRVCIPCHASLHSLPRICITGHASVFLVMRMYPHAKHLYSSATRLCIPSCQCHTSVCTLAVTSGRSSFVTPRQLLLAQSAVLLTARCQKRQHSPGHIQVSRQHSPAHSQVSEKTAQPRSQPGIRRQHSPSHSQVSEKTAQPRSQPGVRKDSTAPVTARCQRRQHSPSHSQVSEKTAQPRSQPDV